MAVLAEAISVIFQCASLEEKYEGGAAAFARYCRKINNTFCTDGELARIGFPEASDVKDFVEKVRFFGLLYTPRETCVDLAVVDQREGVLRPCEWISVKLQALPGRPDTKILACRLLWGTTDTLALPSGWRYEKSMSEKAAMAMAAKANPPPGREPGLALLANSPREAAALAGLRARKK